MAISTPKERPMHSSPWHVLHVLSNHEKKVAQHLQVRSVEYYLPLYKEKVRWTDRTVVAERPLFSGYVFARFDHQFRIPVISTPGVLRLLGDQTWDMVDDEELEKIRIGLAKGLAMRPHPTITVGTKVRIRDGVFAGVEGVVSELRQQCKVIITLAAVRQCFSLEAQIDELQVLNKSDAKSRIPALPAYGYSVGI
jgi:transcription antitermination factor NusG